MSEFSIKDVFHDETLISTSDGYKMECPNCGLQGGRTHGFTLYEKTNTWYCFSCQCGGNIIEAIAVKFGFLQCKDFADGQKPLKGELFKQTIDVLEKNYSPEYVEFVKNKCNINQNNFVDKFKNRYSLDVEDSEDEIEIINNKQPINFETEKSLIAKYSQHLPLYNNFKESVIFYNQNPENFYRPFYYQLMSIKEETFVVGDIPNLKSDNRMHSLILAGAGKGKGIIKNTTKKLSTYINKKCYEITALSHREQLIGKTKYDKKSKKPIYVYGILASNCVIHDEAQNVINEKDSSHAESQRVKRQATDTFGENEISKKLIDDLLEDALSYYPECRTIDLCHPTQLENIFFSSGSARRYTCILNLEQDTEIDLDSIYNIKNCKDINTFLDDFSKLNTSEELSYSEDCINIINDFSKAFLFLCLNSKNNTLIRYALNNLYTIRLHFFKICNILNSAHNLKKSDSKITFWGCLDTFFMQFQTLETISNKADLELNQDCWNNLEKKYVLALEYLFRKGAVDSNLGVTIKRFQTVLAEIFGVAIRQSRSHMHYLKESGMIDSKQIGKNDSSVWLLKYPKDLKLKSNKCELNHICKFLNDNFKGGNQENGGMPPLNEFILDENGVVDGKGGKGGSDTPPISNIIYTRYNFSNFLFFIYNIIEGTPNHCHPYHPIKDNKDISTTKDDFKGGNDQKTPLSPIATLDDNNITNIDTNIEKSSSNKQKDRKTHFLDADETQNIILSCTKDQILDYIQKNPNYSSKELYDKFGTGCFKLRNELKKEGIIK